MLAVNLQVLLLQLPVPNNPATNIPLAAGYLQAYAERQGLPEGVVISIMPRAVADHAGDAALVRAIVARQPDVLGVSLYTWNSERTLHVAALAKQQLPGLVVIGGGPELQRGNDWLLRHPGLDIGVVGEGEQTFYELLCHLSAPHGTQLDGIAGLALRRNGELVYTPPRVALADLAVVPSPYLGGQLDVMPGGMLMVEVSRWCPYGCSFCLYGRNMGSKLGNRYFGLERVLHEIAWGKARGVRAVHFIEANLNLVPLFWPLMRALADLNADKQLTFYAELRGEHLSDEVVAALDRANVRVVEVGLQTANPLALKAAGRRTDLRKWAAGTRRLYAHQIEVYLDVILGLPADDAAGVAQTLAFIEQEDLGPYDIFTLQVLPGTAVRQQAAEYGLVYQERPPYYVLATDRLDYNQLRRLRRQLKRGVGLDPDAVEGVPAPRRDALAPLPVRHHPALITRLNNTQLAAVPGDQLAQHVDLVLDVGELPDATPLLAKLIGANLNTIIDLYLHCDHAPTPAALDAWRAALPFAAGYLDRVAVYGRSVPEPQHQRVSPRLFLVLPWTAQADPHEFDGVAQLIWRYELAPDEEPPLNAWRGAGGAGVWVPGASSAHADAWEREAHVVVWHGCNT
jgi:radical SAM superfamily enzyme YgiQ (UPF0313 family)